MNILLVDGTKHLTCAPLTLTRPIGNLRIGILTNNERWNRWLPSAEIGYETEAYLARNFSSVDNCFAVDGGVLPNEELVATMKELPENANLTLDGKTIVSLGDASEKIEYQGEAPIIITNRWDLFQENGRAIAADFELITKDRVSVQLSSSNTVIGDPTLVFLEEGASVEACTLNTKGGAIYIGKNAEIMEGSLIRGPFAMCESSGVKMGAKIYGPTTLGPNCKVGGEVSNCIFYGFSNKGHDGFLGNSLIGEWCNLGADTNSSNLKNNYGMVRSYSYVTGKQEETGCQFMGLTMGDHSKCGINTMFNTATVVGVSSNVFGAEFPDKYIPSFQWGLNGDRYDFERALQSAENMMVRRKKSLSEEEIEILRHIADTNATK